MYPNLGKLLFFFVLFSLGACSNYNKLLKSNDAELKYTESKKLFEKKQYQKASPLLDDLIVRFKGDRRFEEVYFMYAQCKYELREIAMAGFHFKNFHESFPSSTRAEEALYLFVMCSYQESYPYYLDPESTQKAIDNFQLFINLYPQSAKVTTCNDYMDELRGRLRKKAYLTAKLYMKMEDYKAAIIAFNNTLKDFPELENKEEVAYLIVKCNYDMASNSVEYKKKERYEEVLKSFNQYKDEYGSKGKYFLAAQALNDKAQKLLK
jgi:outer membrane protein assembly factor BamD